MLLWHCFEDILPAFDMQPDTCCDNGRKENNRRCSERLECMHLRKGQTL